MDSSLEDQLAAIVHRAAGSVRAYLCDGDPKVAIIWDERTQIMARLALRADELWMAFGSGALLRFVADSEGALDQEGIEAVLATVLNGNAFEYFGAAEETPDDVFAAGYEADGFSGGLGPGRSLFRARIAGPFASAGLIVLE